MNECAYCENEAEENINWTDVCSECFRKEELGNKKRDYGI